MAKRPVPIYDFKAFGAAIKAARNEYAESRKKVSDELFISPRYLANIENKGQLDSASIIPPDKKRRSAKLSTTVFFKNLFFFVTAYVSKKPVKSRVLSLFV